MCIRDSSTTKAEQKDGALRDKLQKAREAVQRGEKDHREASQQELVVESQLATQERQRERVMRGVEAAEGHIPGVEAEAAQEASAMGALKSEHTELSERKEAQQKHIGELKDQVQDAAEQAAETSAEMDKNQHEARLAARMTANARNQVQVVQKAAMAAKTALERSEHTEQHEGEQVAEEEAQAAVITQAERSAAQHVVLAEKEAAPRANRLSELESQLAEQKHTATQLGTQLASDVDQLKAARRAVATAQKSATVGSDNIERRFTDTEQRAEQVSQAKLALDEALKVEHKEAKKVSGLEKLQGEAKGEVAADRMEVGEGVKQNDDSLNKVRDVTSQLASMVGTVAGLENKINTYKASEVDVREEIAARIPLVKKAQLDLSTQEKQLNVVKQAASAVRTKLATKEIEKQTLKRKLDATVAESQSQQAQQQDVVHASESSSKQASTMLKGAEEKEQGAQQVIEAVTEPEGSTQQAEVQRAEAQVQAASEHKADTLKQKGVLDTNLERVSAKQLVELSKEEAAKRVVRQSTQQKSAAKAAITALKTQLASIQKAAAADVQRLHATELAAEGAVEAAQEKEKKIVQHTDDTEKATTRVQELRAELASELPQMSEWEKQSQGDFQRVKSSQQATEHGVSAANSALAAAKRAAGASEEHARQAADAAALAGTNLEASSRLARDVRSQEIAAQHKLSTQQEAEQKATTREGRATAALAVAQNAADQATDSFEAAQTALESATRSVANTKAAMTVAKGKMKLSDKAHAEQSAAAEEMASQLPGLERKVVAARTVWEEVMKKLAAAKARVTDFKNGVGVENIVITDHCKRDDGSTRDIHGCP
eukprot:TRINITY_DN791_c0_g1_i2.p1 TRINITY_DN791_c0_g1~~TRINITY_DN791_c0_g1_i2.p1  ORF type:complete len:834 (-),score=337.91 TRINITY_DN791_c0_g1_i2:59-2560(-)